VLRGDLGSLDLLSDDLDPLDAKQVTVSIERLIAKFPTIAAYANKHALGHPFMYPDNKLGYVENFLRMMFGTPCEEFVVDPVVAHAIDVLLILHADHEQNCSTSTVRLAGSSHANLFASMSAGIAALWDRDTVARIKKSSRCSRRSPTRDSTRNSSSTAPSPRTTRRGSWASVTACIATTIRARR